MISQCQEYYWHDRFFFSRDRKGRERNQSPKGNMWSAIPDALHYMIVKLDEEKHEAGQRPQRGQSPVEHRGLSFIRPSAPPTLPSQPQNLPSQA